MSHLLLVLGGARSGKSAYAEQRVQASGDVDVTYVGTLLPGDPAVDARISAHNARRPAAWSLLEAGYDVVAAMGRATACTTLLLDGFELALAVAQPADDAAARTLAEDVALATRHVARDLVVIVSAEAGLGVVPATAAGVAFRDRLGAANQVLAAAADEVVMVVAGLPLWLRGAPR